MDLKIVIVSALFPPEPVVSAQLSYDIANFLVDKGCQVTVICPFPTRPLGFNFSGLVGNGESVEQFKQREVCRL